MKTTSKSIKSELKNRADQQSSTNNTPAAQPQAPSAPAPAPAQKPDNRLPIDREQRIKNRTLPTPTVLQRLQTSLPHVYGLAEVVGKWVWVSFSEQPAAEIRQQLAQLGFHWNRERQAWQHPCGQFRLSSASDPRERYTSYHPADQKPA